jgi:hypothetical protein
MASSSSLQKSTTHRKQDPSLKVGCLFFSLGFLVFGVFFLWAFFTGARSNHPGNPVMRLIFGSVFSLLGLIGLAALVIPLFGRRR